MIACAEEVQSCVAGDFGPLVIPIIRQPIQPADDVTLLESFKNFVQRSITVIRFIVWIVTTLGEYVLTAAESLANGASRAWSLATYLHSLLSDEVEPSEAEKQLLRSLQDAIADERERVFHEMVRENLICGLLFMAMYFIAFGIISKFKRKTERESLYAGLEDEIVYRMSVWMCSVAVAVSVGSITLLPFSVFSVELLQLYPGNYYLQWLTYSSIGSVWNYVFTLSNASLFVLLPFCYFFIESQGFSSKWHRSVAKSRNYWAKPCVMQRIYETLAVCALLIVVLLCLAEVVIKLLRYDVSILSITSLNLPLIYSGVSFCGALLLLISTPYGFSRMFSFIRKLMSDSEKSAFSPVSEADTMTSPPADDVTEVQDTIERVEEVMSEIQESLAADEQNNIRETNHWRNENYGKKRVASSNCGDFYLSIFNKPTPPTRTYDEWKRSRLAAMSLKNRRRPFLPVNGDGQLRQREVVESPLRVDDNAFGDILVMKPLKHHASEFCLNSPNTFATGDIATNDIFATSYVSASTIGSPIFTSTPIVNLPFFGKRVKKLSEGPRRSHSDEAIWKPAAALCVKVVPEGFLRRVRDWFSSLFVISPDSRSGRLLSFINGLKFPTAIVLMLVLTSISLLMVTINTLKLMFGFRSLPVYAQFIEVQTRHKYGLFGAFVEILIILYIIATSFIGLYSLPLMRRIRPRVGETSMTAVIINSSIVLVASSALPVIVNTLGLTTFDLLGAFSSLEWLSSFRIVLAYNLLFITLSLAHLFTQLTAPMRREILRRLNMVRYRIREWRTPAPSDRKMD